MIMTATIDRETALKAVNIDLLKSWRNKQTCIERAQSKPLPAAAGKAFTSGNIKACGKVVSRVAPVHFAILQALDSPLLKMIEQATTSSKNEVDFKASEQWDVCYVFTEDAEAVYTMLETDGVKAIRQAAKKAVGLKWDAAAVNLVMLAVLEQIKRHVQTTVRMASEMKDEGEVSFFQEQPEKL
jgi:hypothetical protein